MRTARAVAQRLSSAQTVDPLGGRLPRAADDASRCADRGSGCDEIAHTLTLSDGQDRICMKALLRLRLFDKPHPWEGSVTLKAVNNVSVNYT
jgi:hypothetical protein